MDIDFQNTLVMKVRRRKGLIAGLTVFPLESEIPKNLIFCQIHLPILTQGNIKKFVYWINDK